MVSSPTINGKTTVETFKYEKCVCFVAKSKNLYTYTKKNKKKKSEKCTAGCIFNIFSKVYEMNGYHEGKREEKYKRILD